MPVFKHIVLFTTFVIAGLQLILTEPVEARSVKAKETGNIVVGSAQFARLSDSELIDLRNRLQRVGADVTADPTSPEYRVFFAEGVMPAMNLYIFNVVDRLRKAPKSDRKRRLLLQSVYANYIRPMRGIAKSFRPLRGGVKASEFDDPTNIKDPNRRWAVSASNQIHASEVILGESYWRLRKPQVTAYSNAAFDSGENYRSKYYKPEYNWDGLVGGKITEFWTLESSRTFLEGARMGERRAANENRLNLIAGAVLAGSGSAR